MYLLKCKCNCMFTVKTINKDYDFSCQECGNQIKINPYMRIQDLANSLEKSGASLEVIPDDAKISVTFNT